MSDMTLSEALATPEVKAFLADQIQECVADALPAAVEAELAKREPELRESLREEIGRDQQLNNFSVEAARLIEAARLPQAAKTRLLEEYAVTEVDDRLVPGRSLGLIESVKDDSGKVTKTATAVLRETLDADIKRYRDMLRESAPSVPIARGGGDVTTPAEGVEFGAPGEEWSDTLRESGLDLSNFGIKTPETTTTEPASAA